MLPTDILNIVMKYKTCFECLDIISEYTEGIEQKIKISNLHELARVTRDPTSIIAADFWKKTPCVESQDLYFSLNIIRAFQKKICNIWKVAFEKSETILQLENSVYCTCVEIRQHHDYSMEGETAQHILFAATQNYMDAILNKLADVLREDIVDVGRLLESL